MKKTTRDLNHIHNVILDYQRKTGFNMTTRQLCDALGLKSTSTGHYYITKLDDLGLIEKNGKQFRALNKPYPSTGERV